MALILKEEKLIFVHIPKTGGKSVSFAMDKLNKTNWDFVNNEPLINTHVTSTEIKNSVGEFWDEAFKFSITRNEHDRLVSFYHYGLWKQNPSPFRSFSHFLQYVVGNIDVKLVESNEGWKYARYPCSHWLKEPLDLLIDYTAIEQGWQMVCEYLKKDIELPHINKSVHKSYKSYYTKENYKLIDTWSQQE